jgi:hypothetical protein
MTIRVLDGESKRDQPGKAIIGVERPVFNAIISYEAPSRVSLGEEGHFVGDRRVWNVLLPRVYPCTYVKPLLHILSSLEPAQKQCSPHYALRKNYDWWKNYALRHENNRNPSQRPLFLYPTRWTFSQ